MEFLDIFILGIGILTLIEASKRLDMINGTESFKASFKDIEAEGIREESTSFRLRNEPLFLSPWSRGRFTSINERPILLLISFILMMGLIFVVMILTLSNTKFAVLVCFAIIAFAFRNGPDNLNIDEFYLRKITKKDPATLNGYDVLYIQKAASDFKSWSRMQAFFGLCFMLSIFIPIGSFFIGFILLVMIGFFYLGFKYSIDRAIFR